ncbi:MAG: ACT domain-containing protein [Rhizobiaceae bacterium]
MGGEIELDRLLSTLTATLDEELYVFATLADGVVPSGLSPRMIFQEAEGTTLILTKSQASQAGVDHEFPCRMITLNVHSSLEAVGFIARISKELTHHGMGVNPVAGFYHDHLFVPDGREQEALQVLREIARPGSPKPE